MPQKGDTMQTEPATRTLPLKRVRDLPLFEPKTWNYGKRSIFTEPLTFHIEPYRRFGSIYRVHHQGKEHVVLAGLEANEFVWHNADLWSYNDQMKAFREGFDKTCIFQLDGEKHQKKRHMLAHGFKPAYLAPLVDDMNQVIIDEIAALSDGRADLRPLCKRLTSSMTSQALLQTNLPPDLDKQIDLFSRNLITVVRPRLLQPLWYWRPSYRKLRQRLIASIHQMLDKREADPSTKEDILSFSLQAYPAGDSPLTRHEIALDVLFLLQGGTETASSIIIWALMHIYSNRAWLEELREELRTWNPLTFRSLNDWPKLKATILETERLYPPMPYSVQTTARDFEYQGYLICKRTRIFYPSTLPHFLPEIYENPLSFQPERFLTKHKYPTRANSTFGNGAHACFGQPLAHIKILLVLAHIVDTYDLVFEQKPSFQPQFNIVLTPIESTLPVRFVLRDRVTTI
jgi:cytochrome P450